MKLLSKCGAICVKCSSNWLYLHFVGVGVVGQVGGLSRFWFLAALGLITHPEILNQTQSLSLTSLRVKCWKESK